MSTTTVSFKENFEPDHFANIANLKSNDSVVLVGNDPELGSLLKNICGSFKSVKKEKELNSLILGETTFSKVVVTEDNIIDTTFLQKVFQLAKAGSLVVFLGDSDFIFQYVEENFQQANVWKFDSNFGYLVITDAFGVSPRLN
jgi:hypothetical protein